MRLLLSVCGLIIAAGIGWWAGGIIATADPGPPPVYDHQVAYLLASLAVPPQDQEYFMFDLNPHKHGSEQAKKLAEALLTANKEHKSLGLIGADARHNKQVLRQAVAASAGKTFPDLTLVMVGPARLEQSVRKITAPLHAHVEYFSYP